MKNLLFGLSATLISTFGIAQTVVSGPFYATAPGDNLGYVVQAGGTLHIQAGTYEFDPGRGIEVATGGHLFFGEGVSTLECSVDGSFWDGITIYGAGVPYSTSNTPYQNWGIGSKGTFTIRNAETGIFMRHNTANADDDGNVLITGNGFARSMSINNAEGTCNFINSRFVGIRIHNNFTTIAVNQSRTNGSGDWRNFNFTSNSNDYIAALEFRHTNVHHTMENFRIVSPNDGIHLDNSNIHLNSSRVNAIQPGSIGVLHRITNNNNIENIITFSQVDGHLFGVMSENSYGATIRDSRITAREIGVFLFGCENSSTGTSTIANANTGMEIRDCLNTRVHTNTFMEHSDRSIFVTGSNETRIFENNIAWNFPTLSDEGVRIHNSNVSNIIGNNFRRANQQLRFTGTHPNVIIRCNTFLDPSAAIDAAIVIEDNTINPQGSALIGANNSFTALPTGTYRVRNLTTTPTLFLNTAGGGYGPYVPSLNTLHFDASGPAVDCGYAKMAQPISSIEEITELISAPTPNPFTNYLNVGENTESVQVYSISGQLIEQIKTTGPDINLSHLSSGTYFVILKENNGTTFRHKVVKH